MHETRFINEIITVLRKEYGKIRGATAAIVNVRLSPFSHVTAEGLRMSFKELIKAEAFQRIQLKISPLEILLECKDCNHSVTINKKVFACPVCNSSNLKIQMDKEFFIESIEFTKNSDNEL